ncbi:MAG: glycoside hydrolase family 15 protein [Myxococcota bacterium]
MMDLALIGNCSYQALIDRHATVKWLCWPRFDSSFVFGSLLDEEKGGSFEVQPRALDRYRSEQHYLGLTNIVRTVFESDEDAFEVIDFAPRFHQYERYFKPSMLVRIVRPVRGAPRVRVRCQPTDDCGRERPDSHAASNHIQWRLKSGRLRLTTDIPSTLVAEKRSFLLDRPRYLCLTWGKPLEAPLEETCRSFFDRTRAYWERWVKHTTLPGCYQREVIRSALTLKLHQFEETGAITAAATTSLPEYWGAGRNWDYRFCWIRDAYFTLNAMRRLNHFEETEGFISYFANIVDLAESDLQPVYGISGETELTEHILDHLAGYRGETPVRIGNDAFRQVQFDVYGEMLAVLAPLFLDIRYGSTRQHHHSRLVEQLLTQIEDTMRSPDAGLWEIRDTPKLHTFSLLMHWVGSDVAARIGSAIGDPELERRAAQLAHEARELIDQSWLEELGYFADAHESRYADAALLMLVNLGFLKPDDPRALSHVRALAERLEVAPGLLHRYVHHDGIGSTHATFTVCGFWYAEALARLGDHDAARAAFEALLGHRNHVGLLSEDIDPKNGQLLGNFPQTYSHVGLINAAFALEPYPLALR